MVDFRSKNSVHSCSVNELIAYLKQQNENSGTSSLANFVKETSSLKSSAVVQEKDNNLSSLKTAQKCYSTIRQNERSKLDDGPQKLQTNIKDYFNVVKKEKKNGESSKNKILTILNALKDSRNENPSADNFKTVETARDVQHLSNDLSTAISKTNVNKNNAYYESNFVQNERDLNTSTEVVRKTTSCQQNKRLKLSATTYKQLNVSDFFNELDPNDVDMDNKSDIFNNNMIINKVKGTAQEEYITTDKLPGSTVVSEKSCSKQHETENTQLEGSHLCKDKIFDRTKTFRHIKKSEKLNINESLTKLKVHPKPSGSLRQKSSINSDNANISKNILEERTLLPNEGTDNKNEGTCKTSFDDFCENISKAIVNNSGKSEFTQSVKSHKLSRQYNSSNKENRCFLKSVSTGNIVKERHSHNSEELHSMPTTDNEIKSRMERLEKNKITFDELVENILQNLNRKNIGKNEQSQQNIFVQNDCHLQSECDLNTKSKQALGNVESVSTINVEKNAEKEINIKFSQRSNCTKDISKHILVTPKGDSTCTNSLITDCNLQNSKFPSTNYFVDMTSINSNDVSISGNLKHASNTLQNCEKDEKESEDPFVYFPRSETVDSSLPKDKSYTTKTTNTQCENEETTSSTASVDFLTYFSQSESANRLLSKEKSLNTRNTNNKYENEETNGAEFQQKRMENKLLPKGKSLQTENINTECENKETESIDFLTYFPSGWTASTPLFKEEVADKLESEIKKLNTVSDREYTENENLNLQSGKLLHSNLLRDILEKDCNFLEILPDYNTGGGTENVDYSSVTGNKGHHFVGIEKTPEKSMNESSSTIKDDVANYELSEQTRIDKSNDTKLESEKDGTLEEFFKTLLKEYTNKIGNTRKRTDINQKKKHCIKRYRKGRTKIYRIRRLKKAKTQTVEKVKENVNFTDLYKKITQDFVETDHGFPTSQSASSISTASSYITDDTRSEILSTGSNELTSPQQRLRKGINDLSKDKSLLCCETKLEDISEDNKEEIKMKIQEVFLKVAEDFTIKNHSSLKLRRQKFDNCIIKEGRLQLRPVMESSMTVINSAGQRSKTKFKLMLYIMKKIEVLLETDTKLTKRELYYQLKTLLSDQRVVDRAINAVSCLLNVGMWTLNIIAQKGLVFGNLKILLSSGETLNCNIPGTLIPQDVNEIVEIQSVAYFILVVEKESIFYKLIEEGLPNRLTRPFIMITGKGFPDLNTQLFLKKLWVIMSIPVFILVDADPHGINIMLNYRFGSVNNAHVSHYLAVPNAKWLGVYPSEVTNLNLTRELLSERELKLVNHLLKTPYVEYNPKIADELKVLLEKKCKAEIEGLIKSDSYLSEVYLPNKFFAHNFI